jgi:hypothetical protein
MKQEVHLFYPALAWGVCGLNPNKWLRTASFAEYSLLEGAQIVVIRVLVEM